MAKYKKTQQASSATIDEAMTMAKATQKPGQNKEQTKLIAQGIQKGIAEYKKQQKIKAREQKKIKKKEDQKKTRERSSDISENNKGKCKVQWLPWILLLLSWLIIAVVLIIQKT